MRQRKHDEKQADGERDQGSKTDGDGGKGGAGHPPAPGKADGATSSAAVDDGRSIPKTKCDGDRGGGGGGGEEEELTKHTPEVRTAIYREMAEQKKEKEDRQRENLPKDRDFELEQVLCQRAYFWNAFAGKLTPADISWMRARSNRRSVFQEDGVSYMALAANKV